MHARRFDASPTAFEIDMPIFWRPQFRIGHDDIDADHRYLILLINTVELVLRFPDDPRNVDLVLAELRPLAAGEAQAAAPTDDAAEARVLWILLAINALMFVVELGAGVWARSAGLLALAANVACLVLIARHREGGVHMKASYIFSANDVIAKLGVIAAGVLVAWTGRAWPDWAIGLVIGAVVLAGAVRILRLK